MGIRQEHDKVLKLQIVQTLHSMIAYREREQFAESFESAHRTLLGDAWDTNGYSVESSVGMGHQLRGIYSARGKPMRHNLPRLMRHVIRDVISMEAKMAHADDGTLGGALALASMGDFDLRLKRYGLLGVSLESNGIQALKNLGSMIAGIFKSKSTPGQQEEPFDPKNIDYTQVSKIAGYLENATFPLLDNDHTPHEGKISGKGIVTNLTWGHAFDEARPLEFLKKQFEGWTKFYAAQEQAVERMSKAIMADEKSTRAAVKAAEGDDEKIEQILNKAVSALGKLENPVTVAAKMKPVFPGARMAVIRKSEYMFEYGSIDTVTDKAARDLEQVRRLKPDEARALLHWLKERVLEMKKYTTVFDKARFSDHSDGDEFWDIIEDIGAEEKYASMVYWQSCENDFLHGVDDIADILASLASGIIAWVDRSANV